MISPLLGSGCTVGGTAMMVMTTRMIMRMKMLMMTVTMVVMMITQQKYKQYCHGGNVTIIIMFLANFHLTRMAQFAGNPQNLT